MPLAKCERCDKLFSKQDNPICPTCLPDEEKDHEAVRVCLADNPDLNAESISELTGVSIKCVTRMIDQGFIVSAEVSAPAKCGKCGAPAISATKRLCNACLEDMNRRVAKQRNEIQQAARKPTQVGEYLNVRDALNSKRR